MNVGYIGLGNMGGALATRLLESRPLLVWNRSAPSVEALAAKGAEVAGSPAEVAERCDVIFLCLPTSAEVDEVIFGVHGLAGKLRPGALVVDQTTGDPAQTRRMAAALAGQEVDLIDAPVSGGAAKALAGTIAIMVGAGEVQFARARPILETISPNVFHAGDVGCGHVIKLVNNLLSTAQRLFSFEAVALAAKNGVPPEKAVEVLIAGGGRNAYLEQTMGPRILQGKLNVGFTLALAHKDARLACQLGVDSGVPMFFGNIARDLYQVCMAEMGADSQVDSVGLFYDRLAGTAVVPTDNDLPGTDAETGKTR